MSKEVQCKKCVKNDGVCNEKCLPKNWNVVKEGVHTTESWQFDLSEEQVRKFRAWEGAKPEKYLGAIGGGTQICFTLTSIGYFITAKSWDGTTLDLTEYDKL